MKKNGLLVSLFVSVLCCSGCTEYGAWDVFEDLQNPTGPPILTATDVLDSLYARYTFDDSGSPGTDDSANGLDGTVNGASWVVDSIRGAVLEFNGSSDYVELPVITGAAAAFTMMTWVKISSLPSSQAIYNVDALSPRGVQLSICGTGKLKVSIEGHTPQDVSSSHTFTATDFGHWFHLATVYDETAQSATIYVDGVQDKVALYTAVTNPKLGSARIGGWSGGGRWFDGRMDDLRVYSRALTALEISAVYTASQ